MTVFIVTVSLGLVVLTVSLIIMAAQLATLEDTVEKIYAIQRHPALHKGMRSGGEISDEC